MKPWRYFTSHLIGRSCDSHKIFDLKEVGKILFIYIKKVKIHKTHQKIF